jgi:hypothetical protein
VRSGAGERGAETLEFVGALPLLALMVMTSWQGIVLMRQQAEAEADARLLARAAVICAAEPPSVALLETFDPQAAAAHITTMFDARTHVATVSVTLPPQPVVTGIDVAGGAGFTPHASVSMRAEPC